MTPSSKLPSISVGYIWSGNEAKVVEPEVPSKLEAVLGKIRGIKDITSRSVKGRGWIWLSIGFIVAYYGGYVVIYKNNFLEDLEK